MNQKVLNFECFDINLLTPCQSICVAKVTTPFTNGLQGAL